jgi:hypothetical protein
MPISTKHTPKQIKPTLMPNELRQIYVALLCEVAVDPQIAMKIRSPHGLQDHGEHLHARPGRDALESDGEYGRDVWSKGEGAEVRKFRAGARFSSFWDVA